MARPRGSLNKTNKHIKDLCLEVAPSLVPRLHRIALNSPNEANAIAAAREIWDRAYGKSRQELEIPEGAADNTFVVMVPVKAKSVDEWTASLH